ncbi:unnamed protein product [Cladocopium goreaui]|uniref:Uncharacterized protein n=1 Tax=Cladocopium goreaui TaxID=2562237 RepID=A0A9P1DHG3_9DINO|nr:unnamed protein product [Cladocopium goreaui]
MPQSTSSSSSLAFLSSQLEETRANQMKERSKRTLELMKTAVEWKSWEELRTLTKAFQVYLKEVRETDQRRRRDLQTSVSRVWAARHQLAKADRHKDEAIAQAELLSTGNDGLRNQLEFDARQFVALLQSCAHLERQLAELQQRYHEEAEGEQAIGTYESEAPSASSSCFGAMSRISEVSSGSRSKDAPALGGVEAGSVNSTCDDRQSSSKHAGLQRGLVHCEGDTDTQTSELQTGALNEEIESKGAKEAVLTEMATEAVPGRAHWAHNPMETAAAPTAAQEEDDFGGQSPFGNTQLSETSTVVAMSPSDAWNSPSSKDARVEALRVLSALADLKKKLQLCSAARVVLPDTSFSTTDGTPGRASPGNAHVEDAEDVSAIETGTSRSSVGHSSAATLGEPLRGRANGKLILGPRVSFASQSRCSQEQEGDGQESPSSPFLRPSVLAAEEASRFASMKTLQASSDASLCKEEAKEEESCAKVEPQRSRPPTRYTVHSVSQLVGGIPGAAVAGGAVVPTAASLSHRSAGFLEQTRNFRQTLPGTMGSHAQRSLPGSGTNRSPQSYDRNLQERELSSGQSALPVIPPLPMRPEHQPSPAATSRQPPGTGGKIGDVERKPDASYVATIKLVQELNNRKVPTATSQTELARKEAHQPATSRATCREKPMTRDINETPRQKQRGDEEQSTKACL